MSLQDITNQVNENLNFILEKIKDFPNLSLGEQISYSLVGLGFVLIFIAILLFII